MQSPTLNMMSTRVAFSKTIKSKNSETLFDELKIALERLDVLNAQRDYQSKAFSKLSKYYFSNTLPEDLKQKFEGLVKNHFATIKEQMCKRDFVGQFEDIKAKNGVYLSFLQLQWLQN